MKQIPLTQGKVALVDDADFEELSKYKWFAKKNRHIFYAYRNIPGPGGKQISCPMHRMLFEYPPGKVDHRNGDGLDNQRENLRTATESENGANSSRRIDNTSGFKGVSWNPQHKRWVARIRVNGKIHHLGYYATAEDAYHVYCIAASSLFGEFARVA